MKKKEYVQPELKVVEFKYDAQLLLDASVEMNMVSTPKDDIA